MILTVWESHIANKTKKKGVVTFPGFSSPLCFILNFQMEIYSRYGNINGSWNGWASCDHRHLEDIEEYIFDIVWHIAPCYNVQKWTVRPIIFTGMGPLVKFQAVDILDKLGKSVL